MNENISDLLIFDLAVYPIVLIFYFYQFKDINSLIGYRTIRSMKNQESWDLAQKYCFKKWFIWVIPITLTMQIPVLFDSNLYLIPYVGGSFVVHSIISIYMTEKKLKELQNINDNKV